MAFDGNGNEVARKGGGGPIGVRTEAGVFIDQIARRPILIHAPKGFEGHLEKIGVQLLDTQFSAKLGSVAVEITGLFSPEDQSHLGLYIIARGTEGEVMPFGHNVERRLAETAGRMYVPGLAVEFPVASQDGDALSTNEEP